MLKVLKALIKIFKRPKKKSTAQRLIAHLDANAKGHYTPIQVRTNKIIKDELRKRGRR